MMAAGCAADAPAERPAKPAVAAEPAAGPRGEVTTKRVVISMGRRVGTDVATVAADGTIHVVLDVLENGRGPHTEAAIRLAPDGTTASFEAKGHHEMGTPVDETFVREGDVARWKSHEENGEREAIGRAFFVPGCALPDALGLLAEALLKAGVPLPLLPGGTARIAKTTQTTVRAGAEARRPPRGVNV